jgi:hypothetical protein
MTDRRTAPERIKLAVEDVSKTFRVRGGPGEKDSLLRKLPGSDRSPRSDHAF